MLKWISVPYFGLSPDVWFVWLFGYCGGGVGFGFLGFFCYTGVFFLTGFWEYEEVSINVNKKYDVDGGSGYINKKWGSNMVVKIKSTVILNVSP